MKLAHLQCTATRVTDYSPLLGMPLKFIYVDIKSERDVEFLRSFKGLGKINGKPPSWIDSLVFNPFGRLDARNIPQRELVIAGLAIRKRLHRNSWPCSATAGSRTGMRAMPSRLARTARSLFAAISLARRPGFACGISPRGSRRGWSPHPWTWLPSLVFPTETGFSRAAAATIGAFGTSNPAWPWPPSRPLTCAARC